MPITSTLLETVRAAPERTAISGEDGALSYAQLVADARRVFAAADALHARAAGRTDAPRPAPETRGIPITAVSVASAFHTARILVGLTGYRAVAGTIDPRWPLAHRVRVIVACGIGVVIADDPELPAALREAGWTGKVLPLDEFRAIERSAAPAPPPSVREDAEAFLLLFSSGTTSHPKAFLKTRAQYRANLAVSSAHLEPLPGVATLAPGPVSYSLTLYAVIECLGTGGSVHLADRFDPFTVGRRIAQEGISRIVAVPAVVQALTGAVRRQPEQFAALALVVTGGANLPASLRTGLADALPGVRLISYYGAAEIGFIGDSRGGDGTRITCYPGIGAEIRDADGSRLADGELGTLWIDAQATSDGYLAATSDAALRDADGWASVGDQGRLTGRELELVGRAGDIAVTGGHKVALTEIDRAYADAPGIVAAVAIALPDPKLGAVVALAVEDAAGVSREALAAWGRERLAPQFVPRQWYRLAELPRTVGGKIRRGETRDAVADGRAERL